MNSFHISVSERNEAIDDYSSLRMLTLDTIAKLTFGGNLHFVDKGDPNHEIIRFINAVVCHNSTADTRSVPGHHDRYPPHSKREEIKAKIPKVFAKHWKIGMHEAVSVPEETKKVRDIRKTQSNVAIEEIISENNFVTILH